MSNNREREGGLEEGGVRGVLEMQKGIERLCTQTSNQGYAEMEASFIRGCSNRFSSNNPLGFIFVQTNNLH